MATAKSQFPQGLAQTGFLDKSSGSGVSWQWLQWFFQLGNTVQEVNVPSSATAKGTPGQIAIETDWLYVCVAANTWKRVALVTF